MNSEKIEIVEFTPAILSKKGGHSQFLQTLSALSPVTLCEIELKRLLLKRKQRGFETFVLLENEIIFGTAAFFIDYKIIHDGEAVGYIEEVAVHPHRRKLGYGLTLVNWLIQYGWQEGCRKLLLNCKNELCSFYEKAGFKSVSLGMEIRNVSPTLSA